jgi:ribosomal protein L40E
MKNPSILTVGFVHLRLTPIIFIFAMVFAVASVPYAIGQTFTSMTNVFTTTGLYTSNVYSTNTVGTTTQTIVTSNTFASTTNTISQVGGHHCFFDYWNVTIDPGTLDVTGTIGPPSSKIDFFIMNQNQYFDFDHSTCGAAPYSAEVAVYGLTSTYSLDWNNPPPGWYYFIFSSETFGTAAQGTITTPFVLVATFNQVQTSTVYNVVTNQVSGAETQTVTSLEVTQVPPSIGIGSGLNLEIIGGIIVVVLVVVAALYLVKSRPKPEGERGAREERRATVTQRRTDDKQFCLECGKPLPVGSKFCNKCGAAQE